MKEYSKKINYDKAQMLNDELDYLEKFNITPYKLKKFENKINAIITSIDVDVRSNTDFLNELKLEIDEEIKKPYMKDDWSQDPWYKLFKKQNNLFNLLVRINAFKTWMIRFLVLSNNMISEYTEHLNEEYVDLKKIETKADMMEKLLEIERKKVDRLGETKESKDSFNMLKDQISNQNDSVANIVNDISLLKEYIEKAAKKEAEYKIEKLKTDELDKKLPDKEEDKIEPKEIEIITVTKDEELQPDKTEIVKVPIVKEIDNEPKTNDIEIIKDGDFESLEKAQKFFDEFASEIEGETEAEGDSIYIRIENAEDMENLLQLNRSDYKTEKDKKELLEFLALNHNDFLYTRDALAQFLNWNARQVSIWITKLELWSKLEVES